MEENILYSYTCVECDAEYITDEQDIRYCDSERCLDKDHRLSGPYIVK